MSGSFPAATPPPTQDPERTTTSTIASGLERWSNPGTNPGSFFSPAARRRAYTPISPARPSAPTFQPSRSTRKSGVRGNQPSATVRVSRATAASSATVRPRRAGLAFAQAAKAVTRSSRFGSKAKPTANPQNRMSGMLVSTCGTSMLWRSEP